MNNLSASEFGWCDLVGQPLRIEPLLARSPHYQTTSEPAIGHPVHAPAALLSPLTLVAACLNLSWNVRVLRCLLTLISLITIHLSSVSVARADSNVAITFEPSDSVTESASPPTDAIALATPAPPPSAALAAPPTVPASTPPAPTPVASSSPTSPALDFTVATTAPPPVISAPPSVAPAPSVPDTNTPPSEGNLFAGGSDSLVARTVGHAEGTRTPDGSKTRAYEGHTDPGNGVWNLGSFSFQHCREAQYNCSTPEQADVHQLRRLEGQAERLRQRADALGLELTLAEELNGIDLANQAPLAALGTPEAYPEHLARAKQMGLTGQDAILEGRVWAYWNTTTGRWEAPGLGNTEANIRHDQNRRMQAIARALDVYQQQVAAGKLPHVKEEKVAANLPEQPIDQEQRADLIISQNLD